MLLKKEFLSKAAFCLCFDKLNMTESCQSELVEDGFREILKKQSK
jgi:hypothetical protein